MYVSTINTRGTPGSNTIDVFVVDWYTVVLAYHKIVSNRAAMQMNPLVTMVSVEILRVYTSTPSIDMGRRMTHRV